VRLPLLYYVEDSNGICREEDVSETMYKETLRNTNVNGNSGRGGSSSKVNRICDGFLEALQTRVVTNIQNIITAHVCKLPPDLDAGLSVVAKLRGKCLKAQHNLASQLLIVVQRMDRRQRRSRWSTYASWQTSTSFTITR
jgi:hypothetical protein